MTRCPPGPVVITCGPARVWLDEVRYLTNHATGAIGTALAEAFVGCGRLVELYRGVGSTAPGPSAPGTVIETFEAAEDLAARLAARSRQEPPVAAVLHAAALNDYVLGSVRGMAEGAEERRKWRSDAPEIQVSLVRGSKVLPKLRGWFPSAWIVGWKLELDGSRSDAIRAAARQVAEHGGDACVVNGRAFGSGFGLVERDGLVWEVPDKVTLAERLVTWFCQQSMGC